MRQLFVKIHVYGGLLCSAYVVIFGLSSLNFNHHFIDNERETSHWQSETGVAVPPPLPDPPDGEEPDEAAKQRRKQTEKDHKQAVMAAAKELRDDLGLFGWPLGWESWVENDGALHTEIHRPGRQYEIVVSGGIARVEERRLGLWNIVMPMHGFQRLPGSHLVSSWRWYTEITTWFVLFMVVSGVYLWTFRKRERRMGLVLLLSTGMAATAFFTYVIVWA